MLNLVYFVCFSGATRRGTHSITVQVFHGNQNKLGDFEFEYRDRIADLLVDEALSVKDSGLRQKNNSITRKWPKNKQFSKQSRGMASCLK